MERGLCPSLGASGLPSSPLVKPLEASIHFALPVSESIIFFLYFLTVPSGLCGLAMWLVVCLVGSLPLFSNDLFAFFFLKNLLNFLFFEFWPFFLDFYLDSYISV